MLKLASVQLLIQKRKISLIHLWCFLALSLSRLLENAYLIMSLPCFKSFTVLQSVGSQVQICWLHTQAFHSLNSTLHLHFLLFLTQGLGSSLCHYLSISWAHCALRASFVDTCVCLIPQLLGMPFLLFFLQYLSQAFSLRGNYFLHSSECKKVLPFDICIVSLTWNRHA